MARGRDERLWSHTAALMALTANCHRDRKHRAYSPLDFDPTVDAALRKRRPGYKLDAPRSIELLKNVFLPGHARQASQRQLSQGPK